MTNRSHSFVTSLVAGGTAGLSVDVFLFPLDTIKTRLQSGNGFLKAGGLRGIYSGLGSIAVGSVPSAAFFFCSYDYVKRLLHKNGMSESTAAGMHIAAASVGEISACVVRVPVEVVKQRAQTTQYSSLQMLQHTLRHEGVRGLYRGYFSTVIRDVPFSLIQFPIWEYLKSSWSRRSNKRVDAWQSALCGAVAGGVAAAVTTPLDVAKTRIMLAHHKSDFALGNITAVLLRVLKQDGVRGLFAGVIPRVFAISFGGAIFLGVYEKCTQLINR